MMITARNAEREVESHVPDLPDVFELSVGTLSTAPARPRAAE
jgi:hypothetical protein